MSHLLEVNKLRTYFHTETGVVKAVDNISYYVDEEEIIGLVGESGCGKSVSQHSILQLIPNPPGEIVSGEAIFKNKNILEYRRNSSQLQSIRGAQISIIFQEPMTSLNPLLTIKRQLTEMLEIHLKMDKKSAKNRALELLKMVGIPDAVNRINDYPHQFSGGMRQRVMIAMALSCNPRILIADEPTTALDVTIQAQLMELMRQMVKQFKSSLIVVTHDLGLVARYVQRIYVMYAGKIVESGTSKEIFGDRRHPYTIGLLKSVPRLDRTKSDRLIPIQGLPPSPINMPSVCAFLPRCPFKMKLCEQKKWPELKHVGGKHYVACYVDAGRRLNNEILFNK
jgi:peptide/nickel transport system ATP-binding protein